VAHFKEVCNGEGALGYMMVKGYPETLIKQCVSETSSPSDLFLEG
jgi:hypothetical protein